MRHDIEEAVSTIDAIIEYNNSINVSSFFLLQLNTLSVGLADMNMNKSLKVVPQATKEVMEESLGVLLGELAKNIKTYYSTNDFDVNDQVISIMREVVKINEMG